MNQRRRLLNLARKGDPKAIDRLFELYQVRVYSGATLKKRGRLPAWPSPHSKPDTAAPAKRTARKRVRPTARRPARAARPTRRPAAAGKAGRKRSHR